MSIKENNLDAKNQVKQVCNWSEPEVEETGSLDVKRKWIPSQDPTTESELETSKREAKVVSKKVKENKFNIWERY